LITADASLAAEVTHQGQGQGQGHGRGQHEEFVPLPMPTMSQAWQTHSQSDPHSPREDRHPDLYKVISSEESELVYLSDLTRANEVARVEARVEDRKSIERRTGSVIQGPAQTAPQSPSQGGGNSCDAIISKIDRLLTSSDESAFLLSANLRLGRLSKSKADRCAPMMPQIVRRATDPETVSTPLEWHPSQPKSMHSRFTFLSESKWARQKIGPLESLGSFKQSIPGLPPARIFPGTIPSTNCERTVLARQASVNSKDKIRYNLPFLLAFSGYEVPPSNIKDIRAAIKEGNDKTATLPKVGVAQAMPFASRSEPLSTRPNIDRLRVPWSSTEKANDTHRVPTYEVSTESPSGRLR